MCQSKQHLQKYFFSPHSCFLFKPHLTIFLSAFPLPPFSFITSVPLDQCSSPCLLVFNFVSDCFGELTSNHPIFFYLLYPSHHPQPNSLIVCRHIQPVPPCTARNHRPVSLCCGHLSHLLHASLSSLFTCPLYSSPAAKWQTWTVMFLFMCLLSSHAAQHKFLQSSWKVIIRYNSTTD